MIKFGRLRVDNFKSFDEPFEMDFGESDLLILDGPNGYGKTTLFDAIELCFSGKVGRVKNTDNKYKTKHVLQNNELNPTTVFLELKKNNSVIGVIYALVESSEKSKPESSNAIRRVLAGWPTSFQDESEFYFLDGVTVESLIENEKIKDVFDVFNYIQQEDTCHFLKNKESDRHEKINFLFGTQDQAYEKDKVQKVVDMLEDSNLSLEREIDILNVDIKDYSNRVKSDLGLTEGVSGFTNKIKLPDDRDLQSPEVVASCKKDLDNILWVLSDISRYEKLKLSYNVFKALRLGHDFIKNVLIFGNVDDFEVIKKNNMRLVYINDVERKSNDFKNILWRIREVEESGVMLSVDLVRDLQKIDEGLSGKYGNEIKLYHQSIEGIDESLKLANSFAESRKRFKFSVSQYYTSNDDSGPVACPFCGDLKPSFNALLADYAMQSKFFEGFNKFAVSENERLSDQLLRTFVKECADLINDYLSKSLSVIGLKESIVENITDYAEFRRVTEFVTLLRNNDIHLLDGLMKQDVKDYFGDDSDRVFKAINILSSIIEGDALEGDYSEMLDSMSRCSLTCRDGGVYSNDRHDFQVHVDDVINDLKFIDFIYTSKNSSTLKSKMESRDVLIKKKNRVSETLDKLKRIIRVYNNKIKIYEREVAKQIAIPFYIYSSKILQTRPDGNGVYLKVAENNLGKGFIRFVSDLSDEHDAWNTMSSGQLSGLVISFMLAMNKVYPTNLSVLLIDDPVQSMDDINFTSLTQLIYQEFKEYQLVVSTHERKVANYFSYKFRDRVVTRVNMKHERLQG